jgi:hypothetical protein
VITSNFEGIRGPVSGGATDLLSSTGRYAFHATGRVVLEDGVKVLKSDQLLFDDTFRAPGLDAFAVGEKAFVFGIAPEDYDYVEPRNGRTIRASRTGLGYSSTGHLSGNTFVAADSTIVEVEFGGTLPPGQLAYVAGELDLSNPEAPLVHQNVVLLRDRHHGHARARLRVRTASRRQRRVLRRGRGGHPAPPLRARRRRHQRRRRAVSLPRDRRRHVDRPR